MDGPRDLGTDSRRSNARPAGSFATLRLAVTALGRARRACTRISAPRPPSASSSTATRCEVFPRGRKSDERADKVSGRAPTTGRHSDRDARVRRSTIDVLGDDDRAPLR
jgi:hypothetical protein